MGVVDSDTVVLKEQDGQVNPDCDGFDVAVCEGSMMTAANVPAVIGKCHSSPCRDASGIDCDLERAELEETTNSITNPAHEVASSGIFSHIWKLFVDNFPVVADACAVLVGVCMKSVFYGPEAPLQFLTTSIAVM